MKDDVFTCGSEGITCPSSCHKEEKIKYHHALKKVWDKIPDSLKEEIKADDVHRLIVLKKVYQFAMDNNLDELLQACVRRIKKIEDRILTE